MAARGGKIPFDLRSLEIFLAVCETGSMAAAARTLAMTQPAVSQAIAELEARTGTTLFDRSVRPLALTPPGGILRQRAATIIAEARQIGPLLKETARGRFALLRAGLVDSLSRTLNAKIAAFLSARADQVSVLTGLTAAHAGALLTRNLDLFIGVDALVEVAGLERIELLTEPYILIVPANHKPPRTMAEITALARRLKFVRYSARSRTGADIERHLRRSGVEIPTTVEFDTPQGVTALVANGEGFAISTPLCLVEAHPPEKSVLAAPLPGPQLSRTLTLVARSNELGGLPLALANDCRETLEEVTLPAVRQAMPWLGDAMALLR